MKPWHGLGPILFTLEREVHAGLAASLQNRTNAAKPACTSRPRPYKVNGIGFRPGLGRSVYADQLISAVGHGFHNHVYSVCLTGEVCIESAENDAGMAFSSVQMELEKMTAIVREQDTLSGGGKRQYFGVRHRGVRVSCKPRSLRRRLHRKTLLAAVPQLR
jgi:hypothetical protein